jgi:PhnB protein
MPKRSLIEQLDDAVQAIIAHPHAPLPSVNARLAPLVRIAAELRDLPRQNFKARLKSDLGRKAFMATLAEPVSGVRQTATPYLSVKNAAAAIEFYVKAFGAKEVMRFVDNQGKVGHAEIAIGNSTVMLADEFPDYGFVGPQALGGSPVKMHLYVDDVDALAKQAVAAGAKVVRPVEDQFYGERSGQFADPFGYTWIISTRKEDVSLDEMHRRFDAMMKKQEKPAVDPIPKGYRTLTPYLVAQDADGLIEFVKKTFGAEETFRGGPGSQGGLHCEVRLGDSMLMIGGGGPGLSFRGTPRPAAFHVYVRDCDEVYKRALQEGATSIGEPVDQSYGERSGSVKDAAGNHWYIATYKGKSYKWEGAPDVQPYLHPLRAEPVVNFLKRAFGAEELGRYTSPDGVIHHTTLKIGDSHLEMGEAQGPYQPMASMFYLYVPDVDAFYRRALEAGATSISEPKDQSYGDRSAGVADAFGNQWYIAAHIKDVQA